MRSMLVLVVAIGCARPIGRPGPGGGTVIELGCNEERTTVRRSPPHSPFLVTSEMSETSWSVVVPDVVVDPRRVPRITAYACAAERWGTRERCPPDWTCTPTSDRPEPDCVRVDDAEVTPDGHIRIPCGHRMSYSHPSLRPDAIVGDAGLSFRSTVTGVRYRRAYVRVE